MGKTFEALMKAEKESQERLIHQGQGLTNQGLRTDDGGRVFEEYRRMKHNILGINIGEKIKTLLFSSPTQGEGNSTVLTHFAMTLSSEGDRVLLVDANLRNPSFHRVFNLEIENGLIELFLKERTLKDVVKKAPFDNLSVITSGNPSMMGSGQDVNDGRPSTGDPGRFNPSSIFGSKSLEGHIEEMKGEADWVLFDSPPINSFNDSIALAAKMDGVVMVVRAEKTRWEVAQSAKQRMENGNGKILGVALNKRRFYIPGWLYRRL